jgi:hypothetical protein
MGTGGGNKAKIAAIAYKVDSIVQLKNKME